MKYPRSGVSSAEFTLGLFACAMFALAIGGGINNYSPVPDWDMWRGTLGFIARIDDGNYSAWFDFHNEHRIILARILFWLDYKLFDGMSWFLIAVNYLLVCLNAIVFWQIVKHAAREHQLQKQRICVSLAIAGWLFLWTQHRNLTWAFQSQFFLAQLIPLCAFALLARSVSSSRPGGFFLACLFGLLSATTMANGILALPLMFLFSLLTGQSIARHCWLLGLSVITAALYWHGYEPPLYRPSLLDMLVNMPVGMLHFTALYLGSPFYFLLGENELARAVCTVLGVFLIVATACVMCRELKNPEKTAVKLALIFFIVYIGGTAFVTASGRLMMGVDFALRSKYTTPAILAWTAFFIVIWANGLNRYFTRLPKTTSSFTAAFCVMILIYQFSALERQTEDLEHRKVGALALSLGIKDEQYVQNIFFKHKSFFLADLGVSRKYSIFGQYPFINTGGEIGTIFPINTLNSCLGQLEQTTVIHGVKDFVRLRGWLYSPDLNSSPRLIRFLNREQRIVGFALTGMPRENVDMGVASEAGNSGFTGYVLASATGETVTAVGDQPGCLYNFHVDARVNFIELSVLHERMRSNPQPTITPNRIVSNKGYGGSDFHRSELENLLVYGSYIQADADTGRIVIAARPGERFYFRSGPTGGRQLLRVSGTEWEIVLPQSNEWVMIEFSGSMLPEEFEMEITDAGEGWGEWSAIALLDQ